MPWFWPNPKDVSASVYDEHQRAFQAALDMRYTFLPFLYSLAHAANRHGRPIGHPASFAFPSECSVPTSQQCTDASNTYMVGSVLIPSDIGLAHTNQVVDGQPAFENMSKAILPAASSWYRWNTTVAMKGGRTIKEVLKLSDMSVFVRAGAIFPLQTSTAKGPIQRSAEAGGVLELQVRDTGGAVDTNC
jgi:alpha-glucosidase